MTVVASLLHPISHNKYSRALNVTGLTTFRQPAYLDKLTLKAYNRCDETGFQLPVWVMKQLEFSTVEQSGLGPLGERARFNCVKFSREM